MFESMHHEIQAELDPGAIDAPAAPAGDLVLDRETMAHLRSLAAFIPRMLPDLIDTYLDDSPRAIASLHDALNECDGAALAIAAHRLKGSSGIFGATTIVHLCDQIERDARAHNFAAAATSISRVGRHYADVRAALLYERVMPHPAESGEHDLTGSSAAL